VGKHIKEHIDLVELLKSLAGHTTLLKNCAE